MSVKLHIRIRNNCAKEFNIYHYYHKTVCRIKKEENFIL